MAASRDGWRSALTVARCVVLALSMLSMTVLSILDDAAAATVSAALSALTVLLVLLRVDRSVDVDRVATCTVSAFRRSHCRVQNAKVKRR